MGFVDLHRRSSTSTFGQELFCLESVFYILSDPRCLPTFPRMLWQRLPRLFNGGTKQVNTDLFSLDWSWTWDPPASAFQVPGSQTDFISCTPTMKTSSRHRVSSGFAPLPSFGDFPPQKSIVCLCFLLLSLSCDRYALFRSPSLPWDLTHGILGNISIFASLPIVFPIICASPSSLPTCI